jgi:hypothetical protein
MNVTPRDVAAAGFDSAAWQGELLALNPWAREFIIDEDNAEFAAALQKATLARHAEGLDAWNGWANAMLTLKATLEAAGQWAVDRETFWPKAEPLWPKGENEATRVWRALAPAVFSTSNLKPHFETDVSFRSFVFLSAWFDGATFGGRADFRSATFDSVAYFGSAIFNSVAYFRGATFNGRAFFQSATFNSVANLPAAFNGAADFQSATFNGPGLFPGRHLQRCGRFPGRHL